MNLVSSYDLFERLFPLELLKDSPKNWWPGYGTFEVILGALLTQNTTFTKVEISLGNLRRSDLLQLDKWKNLSTVDIMELIIPSGLYRQKSQRLIDLTHAIVRDFDDYDYFVSTVDRSWLLEQKGIGFETADAILCYACQRPVMVADKYTAKLLAALGLEFEDYESIQSWLESGIKSSLEEIYTLYGTSIELEIIYAHFHGMIVEYCKTYCKGKKILIELLV